MAPAKEIFLLLVIAAVMMALSNADTGEYRVTSDGYLHHKVSRCINEGALPISCPLAHIIQILNLTYGVSEMGHCQPTSGDRDECMRPEYRSYGCSGKQTCDIRITEQTTYYYANDGCPHPTYITAHYVCVPVSDIDNICEESRSDDVRTGGQVEGYLSSPNYHMGSYYSNVDCLYTFRGRNVQLFFVSINLTDDYDCLTVEANIRSHTWCGGAAVSENFLQTFAGNTFTETFRFRTGSTGHAGGFLLYYRYDAVPRPKTTLQPSTLPTTLLKEIIRTINLEQTTRSRTTPINIITDKPKAAPLISQTDDKIFSVYTLATILGLIFGVMGVVVLFMGVAYYCTRRRQKKNRERISLDRDQIVFHNMANEVLANILDKNSTSNSCFDNNSCENQVPSNKLNNLPSSDRSISIQQTFC